MGQNSAPYKAFLYWESLSPSQGCRWRVTMNISSVEEGQVGKRMAWPVVSVLLGWLVCFNRIICRTWKTCLMAQASWETVHYLGEFVDFKVKGRQGRGRAVHTTVTFTSLPCWGLSKPLDFSILGLHHLWLTGSVSAILSLEAKKGVSLGLGTPAWSHPSTSPYLVIYDSSRIKAALSFILDS